MRVEHTPLARIGPLYTLTTVRGERVGVIQHHSDRREIVVFDGDDRDTVVASVLLDAGEADGLADLLGVTTVASHIARIDRDGDRLATVQAMLADDAPHAGRPLAALTSRMGERAAVAAVVRGARVLLAPPPDLVLAGKDIVVVIGTWDEALRLVDVLAGR